MQKTYTQRWVFFFSPSRGTNEVRGKFARLRGAGVKICGAVYCDGVFDKAEVPGY